MKKTYEKDQLLLSVVFIFLLIEVVLSIVFLFKNYRTFEIFQGVVISDKYFKSYIDTDTLKKIRSVRYIYIDNKKISFQIIDIQRKILKKNKRWYHEILIRASFPKKYRENDSLTITYQKKKEKLYTVFRSCWKEEI